MKRVLLMAAAALGLAACGDGGGNPVSAGGSGPAMTGGALPNLYTASITLGEDEFGYPIAMIRVCNNGEVGAGESVTYFEYRRRYTYGRQDLDTPILDAGTCVDLESNPLPTATGPYDRYGVKVDHDHTVSESDELDNETWLR
jgi:hypothetical protein